MVDMDKLQISESRNISKKVGHSHFHFFFKSTILLLYILMHFSWILYYIQKYLSLKKIKHYMFTPAFLQRIQRNVSKTFFPCILFIISWMNRKGKQYKGIPWISKLSRDLTWCFFVAQDSTNTISTADSETMGKEQL